MYVLVYFTFDFSCEFYMWSFFACFSLSSLFEVANVQGRVFSLDNIYRARGFFSCTGAYTAMHCEG